jgi:hypothetical protein
MDYRYHNGRFAGPTHPPPRSYSRAAMSKNVTQTAFSRVALRDCVGAYQPENPALPKQTECATIEIGNEIHSIAALRKIRLEPVLISQAQSCRNPGPAQERWIPNEGVETSFLAREYLWKFDRPVEGR